MSATTKIEWTDRTWNPVTGCTRVSPGCDHCYAETFAERFRGTPGHYFESGFDVQLRHAKLGEPLRWRKPSRVFVNSMSDLFHDSVPGEYIARVFAVMALAPQHTFQVLTKRHARMCVLLSSAPFLASVRAEAGRLKSQEWASREHPLGRKAEEAARWSFPDWPLSNVWLGVSAEDQKWADIRIPALLDTPAAVRFISAEPLLGGLDIEGEYLNPGMRGCASHDDVFVPGLDWVIAGGESGRDARPMHPAWARSLRDQCQAAGVPFFFKQWGEWAPDEYVDEDGNRHVRIPPDARDPKRLVIHQAGMTAMHPGNPFNPFERGHPFWHTAMRRVGKKAAGRELDGRTWDEMPERAA